MASRVSAQDQQAPCFVQNADQHRDAVPTLVRARRGAVGGACGGGGGGEGVVEGGLRVGPGIAERLRAMDCLRCWREECDITPTPLTPSGNAAWILYPQMTPWRKHCLNFRCSSEIVLAEVAHALSLE